MVRSTPNKSSGRAFDSISENIKYQKCTVRHYRRILHVCTAVGSRGIFSSQQKMYWSTTAHNLFLCVFWPRCTSILIHTSTFENNVLSNLFIPYLKIWKIQTNLRSAGLAMSAVKQCISRMLKPPGKMYSTTYFSHCSVPWYVVERHATTKKNSSSAESSARSHVHSRYRGWCGIDLCSRWQLLFFIL